MGVLTEHSVTQKAAQRARKAPMWSGGHYNLFNKKRLDWFAAVEPSTDELLQFPGLRALCPREADVLYLKGCRSFPDSSCRILEISQSASRETGGVGGRCCPAITPTGREYVTDRCRLLLGIEQLRLQNIWLDDSVGRDFENSLLGSLAGNAFKCGCCAAVVVCYLAFTSHRSGPTI